ncbi:MAG: sigma 54-interacting transcriptional regulator [Deltaproteobacteria bacterium]|nr:sigma 54-interacting transcriptional regulator [Deltaproteobacteria bacterium]
MVYRLLCELSPRPVTLSLPEGAAVIGSSPAKSTPTESEAELTLSHPSVSRRHARLIVSEGGVTLEDLASSNGTWVEGKRIRSQTLVQGGTSLRFGSVEAKLEEIAPGDAEAAVDLALPGSPLPSIPETGQSTAALAPAQGFLVAEIPHLLARMAEGGGFLDRVQWVGAALFRSIPCLEVEIVELSSGRRGVLYQGRREEQSEAATTQVLEARGGGVEIRLTLFQRGVARACGPVLVAAANLLELAKKEGQKPEAQPRDSSMNSAPKAVPLPDPPSLHPGVQAIYGQAERVARGQIGVLIRGESGTGKEVLADFIHLASRVEGPFVALNCAALPADLLEAELFGIERGVATGVEARAGKFEAAHRGTLFLDEIGDMALPTQAKILRVLQEGEVHRLGAKSSRPARARVLAATHRDLEGMLATGEFRSDLYHRIAGWEVTLPPLRHRRVDIPGLATYFLVREAEKQGVRPAGISRDALEALEAFPWPGNIRELLTEISRATLFLADGGLLDTSTLSAKVLTHGGGELGTGSSSTGLKATLDSVERDEIARALQVSQQSVPEAAKALGIPVSTLYRRMKALGVKAVGGA